LLNCGTINYTFDKNSIVNNKATIFKIMMQYKTWAYYASIVLYILHLYYAQIVLVYYAKA